MFPTQEVLQDPETVLKIKVLESFKSELQIENDNLLAKYKSKAQRVEELTAQTMALKGELDAREADFIVFQSRNGVDAADKVRNTVTQYVMIMITHCSASCGIDSYSAFVLLYYFTPHHLTFSSFFFFLSRATILFPRAIRCS